MTQYDRLFEKERDRIFGKPVKNNSSTEYVRVTSAMPDYKVEYFREEVKQ